MTGISVRTAVRIRFEVGDGTAFAAPGHLAACAGLAPVTRCPGTSMRGEHPPRGDKQQLERALFLTMFAALASRAYYDRKRAEGRKHNVGSHPTPRLPRQWRDPRRRLPAGRAGPSGLTVWADSRCDATAAPPFGFAPPTCSVKLSTALHRWRSVRLRGANRGVRLRACQLITATDEVRPHSRVAGQPDGSVVRRPRLLAAA